MAFIRSIVAVLFLALSLFLAAFAAVGYSISEDQAGRILAYVMFGFSAFLAFAAWRIRPRRKATAATAPSRRRQKDSSPEASYVRSLIEENKQADGDESIMCCGFVFVPIEGELPRAKERPYIGSFLPIDVAEKHPELLATESIEAEEVYPGDRLLKKATRIVSASGKLEKW